MRCYFQNVNGLRGKLADLSLGVATSSYDVIGLVETNLSPDIHDAELDLAGFNIFRSDRSPFTSGKMSGGGALLAVRNAIPTINLTSPTCSTEAVFLSCGLPSARLFLGCVYIPPNLPATAYSNFCDAADEALTSAGNPDNILLMGDFNLPDADWNPTNVTLASESTRSILDLASTHNLNQMNSCPNHRGVCLDLVWSSVSSTVVASAMDLILPEDVHHPALDISLHFSAFSPAQPKYIHDFRKCDLEAVFRELQCLTLPLIGNDLEAVTSFTFFHTQLAQLVMEHSPVRRVGGARNFPNWFTEDLRCLVAQKKSAHRQFKITGNFADLQTFRRLRCECKYLARVCRDVYNRRVEDSIPHNIKAFWSHANSLKKTSTIPPKLFFDSATADDPSKKCELFAEYFSSVFHDPQIGVPSFDFGVNDTVPQCTISAIDIERRLNALNPNKGAGPDEIPPLVLKYCSTVLAPHLAILFSALLSAGIFPVQLKHGFVIPIFKAGDRGDVKNYRPIVIQSSLAKLFESIVLDHLYFYLRKFISVEQHGFLRNRSTTSNLLVFQEFVMSAFVDSLQVDCVDIDFSKAFDKVPHRLLIAKAESYGVVGSLLMWLEDYLAHRTLSVKFDGELSLPFDVPSGVPQGSHLGPLLFDLFMNDIGGVLASNFLMFADDMKIFTRVVSPLSLDMLQCSLDRIDDWCKTNAMQLNPSKCVVISFKRGQPILHDYHIGPSTLRRVVKVRDLGVILTPSLSPLEHILSITIRANSLLGFIFRTTKGFNSPSTLVVLYKALVRPILEYCSVIWSPYQITYIQLLQRVQTRFVRMLGLRLGYNYLATPVATVERQFDLQPLLLRRQHFDLVCLFKLVNGLLDCPELLSLVDLNVPRGTRSHTVFLRRYRPTTYSYSSGLSRLLRSGSVAASRVNFFGGSVNSFRREICAVIV